MSLIVELPLAQYPADAFKNFDAAHPLSYDNCRALAWTARLAYEDDADPEKRKAIRERWGLIDGGSLRGAGSALLPAASTRGMCLVNKDTLIVAFKGSDPLVVANWITDADALPNVDGVHSGFAEAVDAIWVKLEVMMRKHGSRKVFFTGHSLGGALAVVAAQRVEAKLGVEVDAVVTFGAPRVASGLFATRYGHLQRRTLRFIHGQDIVPAVPPENAGYIHVGRYVRCDSGAQFQRQALLGPLEGDFPPFQRSVLQDALATPLGMAEGLKLLWSGRTWQMQMGSLLPAPFRDHLPDFYCNAFA